MTGLVRQGAVFMVAFFMISGFSLYYANYKRNMMEGREIVRFYKKRIVAIYPAYLAVCIIYFFVENSLSVHKRILLLPMDIVLLQSSVDGAFGTWHHSGTWFLSCLLFCYLLSPFFIEIIKQMELKPKLLFGILLYAICAYMPIACHIMGYAFLYSNVIFRCMQFLLGMLLASFFIEGKIYHHHALFNVFLTTIVLFFGVSFLDRLGGTFRDYDFFVIPVFGVLICFLLYIPFDGGRIMEGMNEIAYEFFLGQFFCFKIANRLVSTFNVLNNNISKITIAGIICFSFAIIFHELISKPYKRFLYEERRNK